MTSEDGLPETEVVDLQVGEHTLEVEQVAELSTLAQEGLRSGDEPFWAYLWPSARALAQAISEQGDLHGKRVIDLGCGPGAAGLAAARLGAEVVLTDIRPEAVLLAERNLRRNGLSGTARVVDWDHPPQDLGTFDGIVAADVLYGDGMLRGVLRFIRSHLVRGGEAWLADPNRVQTGGVEGAAKLRGLDVQRFEVRPGRSVVGGVTLYRLVHRPPMFSGSRG